MKEIVTAHKCSHEERVNTPSCFISKDILGLSMVESWNDYCSNCIYGNKKVGIATVDNQTKPAFSFSNEFSNQSEYLIFCKKFLNSEIILQI